MGYFITEMTLNPVFYTNTSVKLGFPDMVEEGGLETLAYMTTVDCMTTSGFTNFSSAMCK